MTAVGASSRFVDEMSFRRRVLRISAQKLADAVTAKGVPLSRGMVANFESGRRERMDLDTAVAIAEVLDMLFLHPDVSKYLDAVHDLFEHPTGERRMDRDLAEFLSSDSWALRSETSAVQVFVSGKWIVHVPYSIHLVDYEDLMRDAVKIVCSFYDWSESELRSMILHGDMRDVEEKRCDRGGG